MAYHVLNLKRHFGKTDGKAVGHEDGVVAEAICAIPFGKDHTIHSPFKVGRDTVFDKAYHSAETCATVSVSIKRREEFVDVVVE